MTDADREWSFGRTFIDYHSAFAAAQADARLLKRPMGLERTIEYGCAVYRVKMIPINPQHRFGWETRCEVVEP